MTEGSEEKLVEVIRDLWALGRTPPEIMVAENGDLTVARPQEPEDPQVFASKVVQEALKTGVRFLQGFLTENPGPIVNAEGNEIPRVRLYTSLEFSEYIDIPANQIVHMVDLRSPFDPLAGQAVWVRQGAELIRGQTGVARVRLQTQFLSGDIGTGGGGDERGGGRWSPGCGGRWSPGCGGRWSPGCGGRWSPGC